MPVKNVMWTTTFTSSWLKGLSMFVPKPSYPWHMTCMSTQTHSPLKVYSFLAFDKFWPKCFFMQSQPPFLQKKKTTYKFLHINNHKIHQKGGVSEGVGKSNQTKISISTLVQNTNWIGNELLCSYTPDFQIFWQLAYFAYKKHKFYFLFYSIQN